MAERAPAERHEMLVGIVKTKADRDIFLNDGWYRVPVASWSWNEWRPRYLALFEPKSVTGAEQCIRYWGEVKSVDEATGAELFPGVPLGGRESKRYYRLSVREPRERRMPLLLDRSRRNPFLRTNLGRFDSARNVNELILGTAIEESLWSLLLRHHIPAEREWLVEVDRHRFWLDFAIWARAGRLAIEADGDRWHLSEQQVKYDKERDLLLESEGWRVMRFHQSQIEDDPGVVMNRVYGVIRSAGGLEDGQAVPRRFLTRKGQLAQQLSMFEEPAFYDAGDPLAGDVDPDDL